MNPTTLIPAALLAACLALVSQPAAAADWRDNGDGTITDLVTGLQWEKKIAGNGTFTSCSAATGACANPHDADNAYSLGSSDRATTLFLEQLNNRCDRSATVACNADADCAQVGGACGFAGHRDWRLPTSAEVGAVVGAGAHAAAMGTAFHAAGCSASCSDVASASCSCDPSPASEWAALQAAEFPAGAWPARPYQGKAFGDYRTLGYYVRAVRPGN